jgi:hypothetical protein
MLKEMKPFDESLDMSDSRPFIVHIGFVASWKEGA